MNEAEVHFAMSAIRRFLAAYPAAVDSTEGVHQFWVDWVEPRPDVDVTLQALARLSELGEVRSVRLQSGLNRWRKNFLADSEVQSDEL